MMSAPTQHHAFDAGLASAAGFRLEDLGYCILRRLVSPSLIAQIGKKLDPHFAATPLCCGPFYGETTRRFGRVPARSPASIALVLQPLLRDIVQRLLGPWCDTVQLNVAQAIEIMPGAPAQFPHRDQDMWRGSGRFELLVNVIWPLTPFTADNGATLIWPDTHGAKMTESIDEGEVLAAVAEPGDAIVFLGSTLHGAGANRSGSPRRGIVVGYSLGWLRAYENPSLAYPPDVAKHFPAELADLVGYRQHRPNLGNFEGQCPSILLGDYLGQPLAATDALRPDQAAALAAHVHGAGVHGDPGGPAR